MPAARTALIAAAVVDVVYTVLALAAYEHRISVVTHDGSGVVGPLAAVVPLRDLSLMLAWLLLLTLLVTGAVVGNWILRIRNTGLPFAPASWWWSAAVAVPLNVIAAGWHHAATEQGAEHMRTVQAETSLLLTAASLALVVTAAVGVAVIRRTTADQHAAAH